MVKMTLRTYESLRKEGMPSYDGGLRFYGQLYFITTEMFKFLGKEVTIINEFTRGSHTMYHIKEDGGRFTWDKRWFVNARRSYRWK